MAEYRIRLAAFEGPLDLLLHLVQQEEVDVQDVPLARIADRFLEICRTEVETLDVDRAGEFLVMASQLLVLKSRSLLPRDEPLDLEEVDPRLDLVRQLLEYKRFKGAARVLHDRAAEQRDKLPVHVQAPERGPLHEEELEVDLYALVAAFQRLLRETGEQTVVAMPRERLPITHFVEVIFDRLTAAGGTMRFGDLLGAQPDRSYVIGAFLALLELIKLRKVLVTQEGFGEIAVAVRGEALIPEDAADRDLATEAIERPDLGSRPGARVVFMGSPEFAVPALRSLVGAGYRPVLVVTPPPRPAGRGRRARPVPVAREAEQLELPLHRTSDVNGRISRDAIEESTPDVIVTAGFGQKLGSALLNLPPHGCLNLHASLLPRHRGASPVPAALRAGDRETGVTLFRMDEQLDHGPVLAARAIPLGEDDNTEDALRALADVAADLLVRTLPGYLAGEMQPVDQDESVATYAGRMTKDDGRIPWSRPAREVHDHVRAVTPWPGAQSAWQPRVRHEPLPVVVTRTRVADAPPSDAAATPGTVLSVSPEGIDVACGEGAVRLLALQPAAGRSMAVKDFLNGRRVVPGDRFL